MKDLQKEYITIIYITYKKFMKNALQIIKNIFKDYFLIFIFCFFVIILFKFVVFKAAESTDNIKSYPNAIQK